MRHLATRVKPLMVNFITPKDVEKNEPVSFIYDAQNDITFFMGGGNRASRCDDGYKKTRIRQPGGILDTNDADRYTDD